MGEYAKNDSDNESNNPSPWASFDFGSGSTWAENDAGFDREDNKNGSTWDELRTGPIIEDETTPDSVEEKSIAEKYTTLSEIEGALEKLKLQKEWRDMLSGFSEPLGKAVDDPNYDINFSDGSSGICKIDSGMIVLKAITSDEYNNRERDDVRLPKPDEKRYLMKIGRGYNSKNDFSDEGGTVTIDGFTRGEYYPPFVSEIDFTFENKAENSNIPSRIETALSLLFNDNQRSEEEWEDVHDLEHMVEWSEEDEDDAAIFLERTGYSSIEEMKNAIRRRGPSKDEARNALNIMRDVVRDIGDADDLDNKINILDAKRNEILQERAVVAEEAEMQELRKSLEGIAESLKNGGKLSLENLQTVFDDRLNDDSLAKDIKDHIGIDEQVIRQLLNKD
jgi:hypothetical protein